MIVTDASAIMAALLNSGPRAELIRARIESSGQSLHAPHLLDLEVLQTVRRYALWGALTPERSSEVLRDFSDFIFARYPHTGFLPRIWELRESVSAYDAAYIALAETLDAPLVTMDARLAQAPGIRAAVEVYE